MNTGTRSDSFVGSIRYRAWTFCLKRQAVERAIFLLIQPTLLPGLTGKLNSLLATWGISK